MIGSLTRLWMVLPLMLFAAAACNGTGGSDDAATPGGPDKITADASAADLPTTDVSSADLTAPEIPSSFETLDQSQVEISPDNKIEPPCEAAFEAGPPNINNQGADADLKPGAPFSIKFDWKASVSADCIGDCARQLLVGLDDTAVVCVGIGAPEQCPDVTEESFLGQLLAPDEPGTYSLFAALGPDTDCLGFEIVDPETAMVAVLGQVEVIAKGPFALADETSDRLPELVGETRYAAHGDFDGDGDQDLVLAVAFAPNVLLINDGKGSFTAAELLGGDMETSCIETAFINDDPYPDLFVGNPNQQSLVLLGDGDGGFVDQTDSLLGVFSHQVERVLPGDLDGDEDTDFIVLCSGSQQERLLLNDGSGVLMDKTAEKMPQDSLMVASGSLGSVDGEGPPDLVFANFISSQTTQLWINDGEASFMNNTLDIVSVYESMGFDALLVDLNNDEFPDMFEANLMNLQRVLMNDGTGKFTEMKGAIPGGLGPGGDSVLMGADAASGDIDLDGYNDIFLSCSGTTPGYNINFLLLGVGNGGLVNYAGHSFADNPGDSRHALMVDVDSDGDLDLLEVNAYSQSRLHINK